MKQRFRKLIRPEPSPKEIDQDLSHYLSAPALSGPRIFETMESLPPVRRRLHAICALYAHTPTLERRLELLGLLEEMTFEAAEALASEMIDRGWRPEDAEPIGVLAKGSWRPTEVMRPGAHCDGEGESWRESAAE